MSMWKSSNFNLWVNVMNFVCHIGENADALLSLYDVRQNQFIRYLNKLLQNYYLGIDSWFHLSGKAWYQIV